jgi:hypothetical protein
MERFLRVVQFMWFAAIVLGFFVWTAWELKQVIYP